MNAKYLIYLLNTIFVYLYKYELYSIQNEFTYDGFYEEWNDKELVDHEK